MKGSQEITMASVLQEAADRFPDHEALSFPDTGLRQSYREFNAACQKTAKAFMALGIQPGERVCVWTTNLPEWVHLQFGLGMIGAVLVSVNTTYKSSELEYILAHSDATTLVIMEGHGDTSFFDMVYHINPELKWCQPGTLKSFKAPFLRNVVYIGRRRQTTGIFSWIDVMARSSEISDQDLSERIHRVGTHDVVNMQYTSGTTGYPKGVMLTHFSIINNARLGGDVLGLSPEDRLLIQVPLFHCFGCVMSTLACIEHGSTMVMLETFDPLKALKAIENERCTAINGVPTMFARMLTHPEFDKFDLDSLRTGIVAGSPCPTELMRDILLKFRGAEIVAAYGLTECSPVITMTRRDDPEDVRLTSVGKVLPGIEARIVDTVSGREMPPGEQGEIITRSPFLMKGYYKMPEATRDAIDQDGWFHTGDLGMMDEQGNFTITGRIKEMIIRGGENIYPREIEQFLHRHPSIDHICVVGIPDKHFGEQILAVIQCKQGHSLTIEELRRFCHDRIARHKIPHYWEFVDSLPMTPGGKVKKYKLINKFGRKYAA